MGTKQRVLELMGTNVYLVPLEDVRVHDAPGTILPATAADDDLGIAGSFGTFPQLIGGDCKATNVQRYGRFLISLHIPQNRPLAKTGFKIRIYVDMETTVADVSCTVDLEAYARVDGTPTDVCLTAAQDMNSLTASMKEFEIDLSQSAGIFLVNGYTWLDCRVTIACHDDATQTPVSPAIYAIGACRVDAID